MAMAARPTTEPTMSKTKKKTKLTRKMAFVLPPKILHKEPAPEKPLNQFSLLKPSVLPGTANQSEDTDQLAAITTLSKVPQVLHHLFGVNCDSEDDEMITSSRLPSRQRSEKVTVTPGASKSKLSNGGKDNLFQSPLKAYSPARGSVVTDKLPKNTAETTVRALSLQSSNRSPQKTPSKTSKGQLFLPKATMAQAPGSSKIPAASSKVSDDIQKVVSLVAEEKDNGSKCPKSLVHGNSSNQKVHSTSTRNSSPSFGKENTPCVSPTAAQKKQNVRPGIVANARPPEVPTPVKPATRSPVPPGRSLLSKVGDSMVKVVKKDGTVVLVLPRPQPYSSNIVQTLKNSLLSLSSTKTSCEGFGDPITQHTEGEAVSSACKPQPAAARPIFDSDSELENPYFKLCSPVRSTEGGKESRVTSSQILKVETDKLMQSINLKAIIYTATRHAVSSTIEDLGLSRRKGFSNPIQDEEQQEPQDQTLQTDLKKPEDESKEANSLVSDAIQKARELTKVNEDLNEENMFLITKVSEDLVLLSEDPELKAAFRDFALTRLRRRVSKVLLALFLRGIKHAVEQNASLHEEKNRKIKRLQEINDGFKQQLIKLSKDSYIDW